MGAVEAKINKQTKNIPVNTNTTPGHYSCLLLLLLLISTTCFGRSLDHLRVQNTRTLTISVL